MTVANSRNVQRRNAAPFVIERNDYRVVHDRLGMCPVGYVVFALALFALACILFIGFSETVIGVVLALACVVGGFVLLSNAGSCHVSRASSARPVVQLQVATPGHRVLAH